jgi:glutamate 5-kinase
VFTRPQAFAGARRMVVKIGSAVLSDGGTFDRVTFVSLVRDLVRLREQGIELVVVSSGAVALGMERMGRTERPTEMAHLQATAAIGQGRLMRLWEDELGVYGVRAAQVLLTHDDLRSRRRFLAARHTLRAVIEMGAVPVVNENDTVAVEEIKMGDNDMLSAQIVSLVGADFLCIVSDVEGLFDRNPKEPGAVRLETVEHIDASGGGPRRGQRLARRQRRHADQARRGAPGDGDGGARRSSSAGECPGCSAAPARRVSRSAHGSAHSPRG